MNNIIPKRCPFCGAKAKLKRITKIKGPDWFYVRCERSACGVSTPVCETELEVLSIWNLRAKNKEDD